MLAFVAELSPLEHADTARSEAMQASFKKRTGRPLIDVAAEVSEGHHIRCRTEGSPGCQQGQSRRSDAVADHRDAVRAKLPGSSSNRRLGRSECRFFTSLAKSVVTRFRARLTSSSSPRSLVSMKA